MPQPSPAPQHCPTPRELDDLELLINGALHPRTGFDRPGEPGSVVTLELPAELQAAPLVELVDPEGLPLATLDPATGEVTALTHAQYGPFRRLHLSPAQVRERYAGRTVVPVSDALTVPELEQVRRLGPVLLLALAGHGTAALSPVALVRATLAAAAELDDAAVVVVPLAAHGDPEVDHALGVRVVGTYAGGDPVRALAAPAEESAYPPPIAAIVERDRPDPSEQGLVLFFTGLSGSGKSTLARALMDRILEQGERSVTSLDGDVVRRNLSAGLTFSKADRETNIRRIGWVAAEISRHGGIAVCSPIAPFAQTRAQVRAMVEEAGGAFFLVHVATPLAECERRDRKGLYAKARRGEIPEFTGISSPYEEPEDAAVRVDTTGRSIQDALDDVLAALAETGYLDLTGTADPTAEAESTPDVDLTAAGSDPAEGPIRVLFVCTANICRSAWLEHTARRLAGPEAGVVFASAGTHGFTDRAMDEVMATTLEGGADPAFRSRPLTREIIDQADLVLTAEASHRAFVLEEFPHAFRRVFTLGQFAAAVQAAQQAAQHTGQQTAGQAGGQAGGGLRGRALIAAAGARRTPSLPEHDVADPYGRGDSAAATAAGTMSTMLSVIIPALVETD